MVLPHNDYIAAVCDALTEASHTPADAFTDDSDTRGSHCYLRAVITLDDSSNIPAARWRHGLILIWEWHTGIEVEDGEPERGPSWEWARLVDEHGQNGGRELFTLDGYASPVHVVACVRSLIGQHEGPLPRERWKRANELDAACEAWGAAPVTVCDRPGCTKPRAEDFLYCSEECLDADYGPPITLLARNKPGGFGRGLHWQLRQPEPAPPAE